MFQSSRSLLFLLALKIGREVHYRACISPKLSRRAIETTLPAINATRPNVDSVPSILVQNVPLNYALVWHGV